VACVERNTFEWRLPSLNEFHTLAVKGFIYSIDGSATPHPTAASKKCKDQWPPVSNLLEGLIATALPNGGLVTWSKHPVLAFGDRDWCAHGFPTIAGYTTVLLDIDGVATTVSNVHMYPEFGSLFFTAEHIRNYQFGELQNYLKIMSKVLEVCERVSCMCCATHASNWRQQRTCLIATRNCEGYFMDSPFRYEVSPRQLFFGLGASSVHVLLPQLDSLPFLLGA
jgi:hypothetical protein